MLTKKAHAGVNFVKSCGLLNHIINMGKQTATEKETYALCGVIRG